MLFRIRREDGSIEPASGGSLVGLDGGTRRLSRDDVSDGSHPTTGTSPETGARFTPRAGALRMPSPGLDLVVEPWLQAQEMRTSFVYWEGAVRVSGTAGGGPASGLGYVELTGYGRSMQGVF